MPPESTWADHLLRHRTLAALASLLLAGLLSAGMTRLEFINDYKIFFDESDPQLIAHEAIQDEYTRSDNVALVLGVDEGDLFRPDRLAAIEALTAQLWRFPRALRVDSLTNYQLSESVDDELRVGPLFEDAAAMSPAELARRVQLALDEPALAGNLLAHDGRTTYLNVRLELPGEDHREASAVTAALDAEITRIAQDFSAAHPDFTAHTMGLVVLDQAFHRETLEDMNTLVPQMFVVIVLLLLVLLRSLVATAAVIAVILLTIPAAMGAAGWIGLAINQINVAAPTIILTLCICDAVHILMSLLQLRREGVAREPALREALLVNLQPVTLTTITTVIGFLCLGFSDSPPFRELGLITAIGVGLAWLFSLGVLPLLGGLLPDRGAGGESREGRAMSQLGEFVIRRQRLLFGAGLLLAGALIAFAPRNALTDNTIRYFDPSTAVRQAADYLQQRLTGMDALSYSVPAGAPGGIVDPAYLRQLDAFARWFEAQPEVTHVSAFSTTIKRLNRNMHGDDPAFERIPEQRELAAQYLLLYELSLPLGLDLNDQINFDKSASRFSARLSGVSSHQILDVAARADRWLATNAPQLRTPAVGVSLMFARIGQSNINSMLLGSAIALIGISLTLMLFLGSVRYGLLSLIPNAFPALMAFGIWGLTVAEVNLAVAAIFSITLGIVVDDTVHFLSKYLRARRALGMDTEDAVRYAFRSVGAALLVTTLAIGLGFLTLARSDFAVNALTGTLVAMTVGIALVYDLLFLPALLLVSERLRRGSPPA